MNKAYYKINYCHHNQGTATFANLAPRAASLRRRYEQEFGEEFSKLRRKRIIPFIY